MYRRRWRNGYGHQSGVGVAGIEDGMQANGMGAPLDAPSGIVLDMVSMGTVEESAEGGEEHFWRGG